MSALPVPSAPPGSVPPLPMSAANYAAMPESDAAHYELQEGSVVMSPKPTPRHQLCWKALVGQLDQQVPGGLVVIPDVELDLELGPAGGPGTVRAPDVVVIGLDAVRRQAREGGLLRASEVLLAVEIISPSSRRTDTVVKHSEYADAGIGHYWIIDLEGGPSLTACHLGGEFGYVDDAPAKGSFTTDFPFPVTIDLAALDPVG